MEIFGVGPAELVLILIIVLFIFGPDQLPEIAKKLGGGVREIRRTLDSISNEVDDTVQPIKELMDPTRSTSSTSDTPAAGSVPAAGSAAPNLIVAEEAEIMDSARPTREGESEVADDTFSTSEAEIQPSDETPSAPDSGAEITNEMHLTSRTESQEIGETPPPLEVDAESINLTPSAAPPPPDQSTQT